MRYDSTHLDIGLRIELIADAKKAVAALASHSMLGAALWSTVDGKGESDDQFDHALRIWASKVRGVVKVRMTLSPRADAESVGSDTAARVIGGDIRAIESLRKLIAGNN